MIRFRDITRTDCAGGSGSIAQLDYYDFVGDLGLDPSLVYTVDAVFDKVAGIQQVCL